MKITPTQGDLALSDVMKLFPMSVRAVNVCRRNGLSSLGALCDYLKRNGSFLGLHNSGKTTDLELQELVEKAEKIFEVRVTGSMSGETLDQAGRKSVVLQRFEQLSVRARNALSNWLQEVSADRILKDVVYGDFDFKRIRNVGKKTVLELEDFRSGLMSFEHQFGGATPVERQELGLAGLLAKQFDAPVLRRILALELKDEEGCLFLFRLLREVASAESGGNSKEWVVFRKHFERQEDVETLEEIGVGLDLTRERVRQIIVGWEKRFERQFAFIRDIPDHLVRYASYNPGLPTIVVRTTNAEEINRAETTRWSSLFIARIVELSFAGTHRIFQWDVPGISSREARALSQVQSVLVAATIHDDLALALNRFEVLHQAARTKVESIDLESVVDASDGTIKRQVAEALAVLLGFRYPDYPINGHTIAIAPNQRTPAEQVLDDVLESLGEPTHINIIVAKLRELFPRRGISDGYIRALVIKHPSRFVSFGRTSTYGLKRWEKERPGMRGGTIRDIVDDVLTKSAVPMHVVELTEHVNQFRDTNTSSVLTNLKLDASGRFTFFPGSFVGLAYREYASLPEAIRRVPGSYMRRSVFEAAIGLTLDAFERQIAEKCSVPLETVSRLVQPKVIAGIVIVDAYGVIRGTATVDKKDKPEDPGNLDFGELPLTWD